MLGSYNYCLFIAHYITLTRMQCNVLFDKTPFKIPVTLSWEAICIGCEGSPSQIQHQWADVDQTSPSIYGLIILLNWAFSGFDLHINCSSLVSYIFYLTHHDISKYTTIKNLFIILPSTSVQLYVIVCTTECDSVYQCV